MKLPKNIKNWFLSKSCFVCNILSTTYVIYEQQVAELIQALIYFD